MKKLLSISAVVISAMSFAQNLIQTNISNFNLGSQQAVQVFASNIKVNDNNTNKPLRANVNKQVRVNANPQVNVQRMNTANTVQRQKRRVRSTNRVNTNISNPMQTNIINLQQNNVNDDIQQLVNFEVQSDNNAGNAFGNENIIEQMASANIPVIQLGSGSLNLNFEMPILKLPSIKFSSRKSVSSSKHKTHTLKKKLAKLNRKMTGKLAFGKKLKIKVDNCFKW